MKIKEIKAITKAKKPLVSTMCDSPAEGPDKPPC